MILFSVWQLWVLWAGLIIIMEGSKYDMYLVNYPTLLFPVWLTCRRQFWVSVTLTDLQYSQTVSVTSPICNPINWHWHSFLYHYCSFSDVIIRGLALLYSNLLCVYVTNLMERKLMYSSKWKWISYETGRVTSKTSSGGGCLFLFVNGSEAGWRDLSCN